MQVADAQAQVTAIAAATGCIAAPSDKGIYTQRSAALFGDLKRFVDIVSSPEWQSFLAAATRAKGGPPGRFDRADKRRYFVLSDLDQLLESAGLSESPARLVRRRIVLRGLSHTCDVCRRTGWFPQEELGEVLRCARCRKRITVDDEGWHSDGEDKAVPNAGSFLYAREIPPEGGDTLFADAYAAFAALPAAIRRTIMGWRACYSRVRLHHVYYPHLKPLTEEQARARPDVWHPMARRQPKSGWTALYIGRWACEIEGMGDAEATELIQYLQEFAVRPEFVYRHHWSDGDVVMWDNRCTIHYAIHDYGDAERTLNRVTVRR